MLSESKEFLSERIFALNKIINNKAKIVVTNISGLARYLPEKELFISHTIQIKKHDIIDILELKTILLESGYSLVNKVDQSLQFALRGDILDVYSIDSEYPIRIEFDYDEISEIRYFDIANQTSIKSVDYITILPASDLLFNKEEKENISGTLTNLMRADKEKLPHDIYDELLENTNEDIFSLLSNTLEPRLYKYYGILKKTKFNLLDYCNDYVKLFVSIDSIETGYNLFIDESNAFINELSNNGKLVRGVNLYYDLTSIIKGIKYNNLYTSEFIESNNSIVIDIKSVPYFASKNDDLINIISKYLNDEFQIVICLQSLSDIHFVEEILSSKNISYEINNEITLPKKAKISISLFSLYQGFCLYDKSVVVLTNKELFKEKAKVARFTNKFKEGTILKSFEDLNPGDYVVHEYQGIGQFESLVTLEVQNKHNDYLKIKYAGGEILYVPLTQFQLVRKYMGKEGYSPRLSRLHTKDWENQKKKVKEKVNELANRLMNLYIERSKVIGFAFEEDDDLQNEFENDFEYELTKDQKRSLLEIKKDMCSPHPMDRLLCGDVGFGKTEVAFRAAFKAILSHKQVAILCPTTLLARQHYNRAISRFEKYGVKVKMLSRLVKNKDCEQIIYDVNKGNVDLLIGTHKILSKNIIFKDLGLLIIDEEQRFGVEQKERIKEMKNNIDVLTLSATPIPRTLQISLLGVRSLSQINTAPINRMPIQTYVLPYNSLVVKELIERELSRKGQVFYLHNDVDSLYKKANEIQKMIPFAHVGVGHGQMDKDDLEDVMDKFYQGDIDVLVCTTIVENGIDIPNANMIIVDAADRYGLSQLYQIKGRVGRSDRIAYAYLMYNAHKELNEKAKKRLKALQEFTALGSGYKIAQRDLLIRGAGDILGSEQAGYIDSIGLDMYVKLLNESVQEKLHPELTIENQKEIKETPSFSLDAYIPDEFAKNEDKIEIYQEIISKKTVDELVIYRKKIRDIYGKIPENVDYLFKKRTIDIYMISSAISSLKENKNNIEIILSEDYLSIKAVGNLIFESLIPYLNFIKVSYINKKFTLNVLKRDNWMDDLIEILKSLDNVYNMNRKLS